MSTNLRPLAKPRFSDRKAFATIVAEEVEQHVKALKARGWPLTRIYVELDVSAVSLWRYRTGKDEPRAGLLLALRALVAEHLKETGT